MIVLACVLVVFSGASAQSICHSNHAQQTEDEVIHTVAGEIDFDGDDIVELWELYAYFDDLLGRNHLTPELEEWMKGLTDEELMAQVDTVQLSDPISRHDFTQSWHSRYHDSLAFIESAFDNLIDVDGDGFLDPNEIYRMRDSAKTHYDENSDGVVQRVELEHYLESIYKTPDCIDNIH